MNDSMQAICLWIRSSIGILLKEKKSSDEFACSRKDRNIIDQIDQYQLSMAPLHGVKVPR